ncbi:16S rRNA (cytosine(1407)-C(5))-methyltransferase RsmF [Erwinia tasmaniensis]|uniref:Ribosomal RNA small subunit methyltransferase F n=1 Tax=Erwinia tasmaniensis (strain DSM 17950 / CFBP 7177 / CIP 109463 / NCPPB 4357 / Et1/99) TaxID=465817 RepID=RSMF_ERWT9|nr:16S rRNA (cytosine(1407)-C(5))-methyltransferase RsmF [Erwinia tasmaniensis]B2VJ83.1 RecName: Full=Ribosomal RNA small subunit methyltransferase F; AltName: Full=16S rRNA m5C1407 methyltransferase; AltName: Full=rRNA (cytosine-C(5)-)-methyltransferase RsmF [Erwinia tasmaniensis Et1/99]CAO96557.1 Conserved hypothetical protein YebU [Erwinia tasmaniensis Et1/99]
MSHTSRVFFPPAFVEQMQQLLPDADEFQRFITSSQLPLRRSLRVNTLKISVDDFLTLVEPYQWALTPIPWCQEGFWISRDDADTLPLGSTAEHLAGLFYIQEASSMLPVSALFDGGDMPQRVMDMAAAPGSKTTQIAAHMGNRGAILANEYSASRVKVLHANLSRCGVSNTAMTHFDGRVFGPALPECFDAVLLDAPCSGEGVVRKDADALRNWSQSSTEEIAATQQALINSAFHALRPGGTLVYSTCTLNTRENQQVVNGLLEQYPDAVKVEPLDTLFMGAERATTAEGYLHVFPHIFDSEGFFVARLRKVASVPPMPQPGYKVGKPPFTPLNRVQQQEVIAAAASVGLRWDTELKLWQRDKELWLFPSEIEPLLGRVRFSRIGLKLAETFPKGFRWQHHAAVALADAASANAFELNSNEAEEWYRGRDIYPERDLPASELIICYQQRPIGIAKKVGSRIKNNYPRELVRDGKLFTL